MLFTKCTYCDKIHLCTYHDRPEWVLPKSKVTELLTQAIIPVIPADSRLKQLFLKWSSLRPREKASLDEKVDKSDSNLYLPLKLAMSHWEKLQDCEGAPGFDAGIYSFSCDSNLEEELIRVIYNVDNIVNGIVIEGNPVSGIETQSEPNMHDLSSEEITPSPSKESLAKISAKRTLPKLMKKSASTGNLIIY